MKKFESLEEVLDFAIKREEESYNFYKNWSEKVREEVKPLFQILAQEELKHKQKLMDVKNDKLNEFIGPGSTEQTVDTGISDYLIDVKISSDMSYRDALIVAMKREKAAFKLYEELANKASSEELKNLFLSLSQEEARHKLKLETLYDEDILPEG